MFIKFSEEARKILKKSKKEMQKLHHAFIGSEHVLLSILNDNNNIQKKLAEMNVDYGLFKNELIKLVGVGKYQNKYFIYTPLLKRILANAIIDTRENSEDEVSIETIFYAILDEGEGLGVRILNHLGVSLDSFYEKNQTIKKANKKLLLSDCSVDLTKKAQDGKIDILIGRDKELKEIIEILLRKNKNNPLLIGEAGVGKTAIIEELANRIIKGDVPDKLKNKKIYSLSMASAVAGTKYRGEFEDRINKILKELENNDDIIVFIDEIHTLVGAGGAEGAIDASNILKPALARGNIKLIGATTINEYKKTIRTDKALNRRFQTIFINENTLEETKSILYGLKESYEKYHDVLIPDDMIDKIVMLTDKYLTDKNNPDKSIDVLDTVCTKVSLKENHDLVKLHQLEKELDIMKKHKNKLIMHQKFHDALLYKDSEMKLESKINKMLLSVQTETKRSITLSDIEEVIESKTQIPFYHNLNNKNHLMLLEKELNSKIIGQEKVIGDIIKTTKKILLGFKGDLPYSFLLVGKSGVGKTLLVKEYSQYLKIPLIRLDMGEYREAHSISRIIGSPPGYVGYDDMDNILEKVKNNPFCLLLLDEIEKACSEVQNLFLSILDDGEITDSHGNKVNFRNTIIMMTSNIGSEQEIIGFKNKKSDTNLQNRLSIPFINRLNKILYFKNLTKEDIEKIVKMKISNLKKKYRENNIQIHISKKVIEQIVAQSDYHTYGARKLVKLLEDKIDNMVIDNILIGNREVFVKE